MAARSHTRARRAGVSPRVVVRGSGGARRGGAQIAEVRRSRMLSSAVGVVARDGFEGMSVARVTNGARVSRRTFYEVFSDREDCFLAVFEDALAQVEDLVLGAYQRGGGSWRDRVRAGLGALLSCLDERPELRSVLVVEALVAGPRVLARRARMLQEAGHALHRDATEGASGRDGLPPLIGEGVVSAVLGLVHARCTERSSKPLLGMLGELMGLVVLPYEGPAAARGELERRGARTFSSGRKNPSGPKSLARLAGPGVSDPFEGLAMRLTYRTVLVLAAIAEHPGASNREIGEMAELSDQGQASKLLQRLERLGLIRNDGMGHSRGETNAWRLTPRGVEVERAVRIPPDDDGGGDRRGSGGRRGSRR